MRKLSIAIVDDDDSDGDTTEAMVRQYLNQLQAQHEPRLCEVQRFFDGSSLLAACEIPKVKPFDLIILDIEMPGIDGMQTARILREHDSHAVLLFTTKMAQYATVGYDVDAIGYLVKPFAYPGFAMRMRRALSVIDSRRGTTIAIRSNDHVHFLDSNDIQYVEVSGHSVLYHTADSVWKDWDTLREVEAQLEPYQFVRSNRYCLVNLEWVTALDGNMVTVGSKQLAVSRSRKKELLQALSTYHHQG